jgi:hypothetical protein
MTDRISTRTLVVIALVAAAITGAWAAGTTSTSSNTTPATEGAALTTNSGLSVQLGYDSETKGGNRFPDNNTVVFQDIRFEANQSGTAFIRIEDNSSQWTNFTEGDLSQTNVSIAPPNKQNVTVGGGVESINISSSFDESATGGVDAVVGGRTSGTLSFDSGGQGVVAINANSGSTVAAGTVQQDGTATFDIPAGNYMLDFQPAPSTLFVYNESAPSQLIDNNANLRIRFFTEGSSDVVERTVTDGTVDLSGLPPDERLIVTVKESDSNYTYRRTVIESLSEQQEVYLLPESQNSVDVEFDLTDYSGNYPTGSTLLFLEKPISKDFDGDGSEETQYQVITGDTFGPSGSFPATLEQNERYRLRIQNLPNQRLLGGFTATRSEFEEIVIRDINLQPPDGQPYAVLRNVTRGADGERDLTFKYLDESTDTTELNVRVINVSSGKEVYEDHVQKAVIQEYAAYDIDLTNDTRYAVEWNATRDGEEIGGRIPVGGGRAPVNIPLDGDWLGSAGLIAIAFIGALGDARKNSYIAITTVGFAGVLMWFSVIRILVPLWFLAALIAVGGHLRTLQSPGQ